MNNRYGKYLGESLKARVEALEAENSPVKSLHDELELTRTLVGDACALYEAALESKSPSAVITAGEILRNALNEVRDMTLALCRVEAESGATLDAATARRIAVQMATIVDRELRTAFDNGAFVEGYDPTRLIIRVADAVDNEIRLADPVPRGTTLTPDQDVISMDESIPAAPKSLSVSVGE